MLKREKVDRDLNDNLTLSNLELENRAKSQERKKMETGSRKTGVMSLTKNTQSISAHSEVVGNHMGKTMQEF